MERGTTGWKPMPHELARWVGVGCFSLGTVFVLFRRLAFGFERELSAISFVAACSTGMLVAELIRRRVIVSALTDNEKRWRLGGLAAVLFVGFLGIAPAWQRWPLMLFGTGLLLTELATIIHGIWKATQQSIVPERSTVAGSTGMPAAVLPNPCSVLSTRDLIQELRRTRVDGGESIHVRMAAELAENERHHWFHIPFCPPLAGIPEATASQIAGPSGTVKITEVRTYGARVELRLSSLPSAPCVVAIEFIGRVTVGESRQIPSTAEVG